MNIYALVLIWGFGIILFFGLLLVTFLIGRASIHNNDNKAFLFTCNGDTVGKPVRGSIISTSHDGDIIKFKNRVIITPHTYKKIYHRGRRLIFASLKGKVISAPFNRDTSLSDSEKETLIYDVIEANIGSGAINAISSKKNNKANILIVAIIAFFAGAIIAYVGLNMIPEKPKQQIITPPITANQTTNYNLEVK